MNGKRIVYYGILFVICLLAVAKICPIELLFAKDFGRGDAKRPRAISRT